MSYILHSYLKSNWCLPLPRVVRSHVSHFLKLYLGASAIVIHTLKFAQVKSMDDNCGEWVEYMGVACGCSEQEAGVVSGREVESMGVVVRRYIDFLILLIPTPLVSVFFCSSIPTFCSFKKKFVLFPVLFVIKLCIK